ncbi:MAG: hypothetical protein CTY19_12275 [Methylomonas sp.]|nr:MAG: hypothetical protein CTY19_12275 [Methylomonas sp.]
MQLPEGWRQGLFEEGIELISGQHVEASLVNESEDGKPYLTGPADFPDGKIKVTKYTNYATKFCNKGDLLITVKGSGTGKVIESDNQYAISRQLMAVRASVFEPKFTFYNLVASVARYEGAAAGLIPGITRDDVLHTPLLIPPFPEQQKIAQILSTWDKAIEKLEALIAAKQKRKKALMQQLLTGKMRFAEFVKSEGIQQTKFGTIPSDWQYLHITEVAKQFSVKNNVGHDLPVLSCTKHYGLVDSLSYFGKQIFSEDTSTYKVVLRNSFAYATNHIEEGSIGYQNLYDKALISPMYTVFQTNENINDEFLYRLLKTELYRHIFEVNTSASVDRRGSLRWDQFSAIKIPVPSLPEQQKIASFFAVTDTEIETHQKQLSALKEQKKGLMQQLLTGKKRVKVDAHV